MSPFQPAQRIDSRIDQIVNHIRNVSKRIRLAIDENNRFFPQIHPRLSHIPLLFPTILLLPYVFWM